MTKRVKNMMIEDIKTKIGENRDLLVVDVSRLSGIKSNAWRLELHKKEIKALSVKNSLARIALDQVGVSGAQEILSGSSTLIWGGEDIVALSKEITKWANEIEELEIKGATVEGASLGPDGVTELSKSPSRLELLSIISGQLLRPGANLAGALSGPVAQLAGSVENLPGQSDPEIPASTSAQDMSGTSGADGTPTHNVLVQEDMECVLVSTSVECSNIDIGEEPQESPPVTIRLRERKTMGGQNKNIEKYGLQFVSDSESGTDLLSNAAFVSASQISNFVLFGWHTFASPISVVDFVVNRSVERPESISVFRNYAKELVFSEKFLQGDNKDSNSKIISDAVKIFQKTEVGRLIVELENSVWELWYSNEPVLRNVTNNQQMLVVTFASEALSTEMSIKLGELVKQTGIAFSETAHQDWLVEHIARIEKERKKNGVRH